MSEPIGSWDEDAEHKRSLGLEVSADERIAWLEEMIALAFASGALPKRRDEWGQPIDSARGAESPEREREAP